jgi:hypothetical protein
MEWLKSVFAICKTLQEQCCSMWVQSGTRILLQTYGHMRYAWPMRYWTPPIVLNWRLEGLPNKCSIKRKCFRILSISNLLDALCMYLQHRFKRACVSYHKWKERARVGIYLGTSPLHGRNVALVLDPATGLVSPQHNVRFDLNFDTVKYCNSRSLWQKKCRIPQQEGEWWRYATSDVHWGA